MYLRVLTGFKGARTIRILRILRTVKRIRTMGRRIKVTKSRQTKIKRKGIRVNRLIMKGNKRKNKAVIL